MFVSCVLELDVGMNKSMSALGLGYLCQRHYHKTYHGKSKSCQKVSWDPSIELER